jgi:competence protein ComEA
MWKFLENYFTFTRREKNGIIVLISATIIVLLVAEVYPFLKPVRQTDNSAYEAEIKAFQKQFSDSQSILGTIATQGTNKDTLERPNSRKGHQSPLKTLAETKSEFYFDPNTIGVKEWVQLGFTEKQAMVIEHYKQSGGVFHKPQDIKKLYVMSEENYERLLPYVKIVKQNKMKEE